jgi:hypothetical protein
VLGSGDDGAADAAAYSMLIVFSWTTVIIFQGHSLFDRVQLNTTIKRKSSSTPCLWQGYSCSGQQWCLPCR